MPKNLNFILESVGSGRFLSISRAWPEAHKIICLVLDFYLNFLLFSTHLFFEVFSQQLPWIHQPLGLLFLNPVHEWRGGGLHCVSHWSTDSQSKRKGAGLSEHHWPFLTTWKNNKCKYSVRSQHADLIPYSNDSVNQSLIQCKPFFLFVLGETVLKDLTPLVIIFM